eukprot:TRINITY_DN29962_c0_g1_i1.p1 TRINITY_DN29962_c0_g1~~TRINITY_DN29962_c0_g1_i1.p1  ORF type:complete len:167 (+),score=17.02 TRINITY_DN29962_c0_g1_i1:439-939(+)
MLEGLYFICASASHAGLIPSRCVQKLFAVCMTAAVMVTTVTYGVLVPGAILLPQPIHREGAITLLFSWQGHVMHSLNLVFMLLDFWFSRQQMELADMPYGVTLGVSYVMFEWVFFHKTGFWHYPFLNYNNVWAPGAYLALFFFFGLHWTLGCKLTQVVVPAKARNE